MLKVLRVELMKLQWWLVGLLIVAGPGVSVLLDARPDQETGVDAWQIAWGQVTVQYAWLFYPLLAGVLAALLCRPEHMGGGWKQLLALPVSRSNVYLAKYVVLAGVLAATNLAFGGIFVLTGLATGLGEGIPFSTIGLSLLAGLVAVLPLAAVQLWVSSRWKSFGASLALNVCFTLPAIFAAQSSEYGPWYPWAQPVLAMSPFAGGLGGDSVLNVSPMTLWVVIVGGFVVAMIGGLVTFVRADFAG
ncbi:MAG: ABC transporter permease [Actinomycetota bacterium]|nr:MAG: hypothetical protein FD171_1926 [Actinomycetota bacterium]MDO8950347.1 ABC transporter permease [Actinomycetota bacterium]MDP3629417.1 ABC transporter permease [Actinomycetota bacterium]